jgi:hypothetical protein
MWLAGRRWQHSCHGHADAAAWASGDSDGSRVPGCASGPSWADGKPSASASPHAIGNMGTYAHCLFGGQAKPVIYGVPHLLSFWCLKASIVIVCKHSKQRNHIIFVYFVAVGKQFANSSYTVNSSCKTSAIPVHIQRRILYLGTIS